MINPRCITTTKIYNAATIEILYTVPKMYVGCYVLEALLQSGLDCYYNATCLRDIEFYLGTSMPSNITAMNPYARSRFSRESTVGELLDKLMVEEWGWSILYADYFNSCDPIECSYTYTTRNDAIFIVTTVISVIGGLVTSLKLLVPTIAMLLRRKKKQRSMVLQHNEGIVPVLGKTRACETSSLIGVLYIIRGLIFNSSSALIA
jgi:hypothetical protein